MHCLFRYVDQACDASVNLYLFTTNNGTARADVKGPVSTRVYAQGAIYELSICLPLDEAFAAAVRMANRHDTELVVSGDYSLWDSQWGALRHETKLAS